MNEHTRVPGYEHLESVLFDAYDRCAQEKGHERHANGQPFLTQPLMTITRSKGLGFPAGQVDKKLSEALGMVERGEYERAVKECLDSIVYCAALALAINEKKRFSYYKEE